MSKVEGTLKPMSRCREAALNRRRDSARVLTGTVTERRDIRAALWPGRSQICVNDTGIMPPKSPTSASQP